MDFFWEKAITGITFTLIEIHFVIKEAYSEICVRFYLFWGCGGGGGVDQDKQSNLTQIQLKMLQRTTSEILERWHAGYFKVDSEPILFMKEV